MTEEFRYIKTNIEILDTLLGGKGFKTGTINIIKGGPGSGKTTLGLQILNEHLKKNLPFNSPARTRPQYNSFFISLEIPGDTAAKYINNTYNFKFFDKDLKNMFCTITKEDLEQHVLMNLDPKTMDNPIKSLRDHIQKAFKRIDLYGEKNQNIFFIDSLNVFVDILLGKTGPKADTRTLLHRICGGLDKDFEKNSIFIFSVEYRPYFGSNESLIGESFFSDTEILLNSETIIGNVLRTKSETNATGYEILANKENSKEIETRPFCRVIKSRFSQCQSRRCSYDIINGKGFCFKEIYPGDGEINLFSENNPQEKYWKECFRYDLKFSFPALRHNTFDRESLQRTFSSLRHISHIPDKTDLYLTSLDNYWINWYSDLKRKQHIAEIVHTVMAKISDPPLDESLANIITNSIHRKLTTKRITIVNFSERIANQFIIRSLKDRKDGSKLDDQSYPADINGFLIEDIVHRISSFIYKVFSKAVFYRCYSCNYGLRLIREMDCCIDEKHLGLRSKVSDCIVRNMKGKNEPIELGAGKNRTDRELKCISEILNSIFSILNDTECNKVNQRIAEMHFEYLKKNDSRAAEKFGIDTNIKDDDKSDTWFCRDCYDNLDKEIRDECRQYHDQLINEYKYGSELVLNGKTYVVEIDLQFDADQIYHIFGESFKDTFSARELELLDEEIGEKNKNIYTLCFITSYLELQKKSNPVSYLEEMPSDKLRLFGEVKSEIIKELDDFNYHAHRPIHSSDHLFSFYDKTKLVSVPYNANISYVVYRKDILDKLYAEISNIKYQRKVKEIFDAEMKILTSLAVYERDSEKAKIKHINNSDFYKNNTKRQEKEVYEAIKELTLDSFANRSPKTWEEIIALYLLSGKTKSHFLIEMRRFDTMMTAFLEFFWSFGGDLHVLPDYHIDKPDNTFTELLAAYNLVSLMSYNGIIPQNSTVDTVKLHTNNISKPDDWVFARHWHSTFVDFLTYEKRMEEKEVFTITELIGNCEDAQFEIMPIPTSLFNYVANKQKTKNISCWGDWHFAVMKGSENLNLGIDIINNLMNSNNITERAFSAAELPTVEFFYKLHGDTNCFNMEHVKSKHLPHKTFKQLRNIYFRDAKSRTQIFDFRHTITELGAIFQFAHFGAFPATESSDFAVTQEELFKKIYRRLNKAFSTIQDFRNKTIMQH